MVAARKYIAPEPPPTQGDPVIHAAQSIEHWMTHYWHKLQLPSSELNRLAITQDRQEYTRWTGKRLNTMALGCYCYLPVPHSSYSSHSPTRTHTQVRTRKTPQSLTLPNVVVGVLPETAGHRHLIFIEPDMRPQSLEVTVAHELIHLADRVSGTPRKHRHHGYDSIAADEAAITGYGLEELRHLLHEESMHREQVRRQRRPIRYLYECPNCAKLYPRTRRYSHAVSCSSCDKTYNPNYRLSLRV
jgi:hypothetical protein